MVSANTSDDAAQILQEMRTAIEDIVRTNASSTWMLEIKEIDQVHLRQRLQTMLTTVGAEAARVHGPRDQNDVSYRIWERKKKVGADFELPLTLSQWKQISDFRAQFMPLMNCTDTEEQDNMKTFANKFKPKNRYSDILPFSHTRVHLIPRASMTSGDPEVNAYINANFVDGPVGLNDRKIIACQGPLEKTYTDFWRMVSQENVTLIVTTCKEFEKGRPKCHRFWPIDGSDLELSANEMMQFDLNKIGIAVETSAPTIKLTPSLSLRSLKLTDTDLGITGREIRQLHYDGWPDHGVPSGSSIDSFVQMFEIFTYMLLTSESTEKVIVHCSAGIGRTGTTIGLAHLLVSLWAQKNQGVADPLISVFSTIRRLREQRFHLVQMEDQYQFIHDFLKGYLIATNF